MTDTLDLVLPVEWPFPALVDIPPEDRPRVAMHIARAFHAEARRWEQHAFRIAAGGVSLLVQEPIARPSLPARDQVQRCQVYGTDR